ncbi:hypothetical protein J7J95_03635, partial [bacterium]|nr:hypothetical protein [bacterium]
MIFNGKSFASRKIVYLKKKVVAWEKEKGRSPRAAFILVGENPEGEIFVRMKRKLAEKIGVKTVVAKLPSGVGKEAVKEKIRRFSSDKEVNGVVVQLPLPSSLRPFCQEILDEIAPKKDIDGLTTFSFERLKKGEECFWPAVVVATFQVVKSFSLLEEKKKIAIVGVEG